uniref:Uncharacterized protein n=1 Tax=Rhizophora mucronata TaxID=61149 RepID=A0A2P2NBF0_RHIMU
MSVRNLDSSIGALHKEIIMTNFVEESNTCMLQSCDKFQTGPAFMYFQLGRLKRPANFSHKLQK